MKKMKGVVPAETPSYPLYDDPRIRFKHQSLLQDYEELQKETDGTKRKLQIMKQKRLTLSAEVRFLRKRYKYLIENQPSPPLRLKQDIIVQDHKFKMQAPINSKSKNYNRKESALRPPVIPNANPKQRTLNGLKPKATHRKATQVLDLNQNARVFSEKDTPFYDSPPVLDLNQNERIYSGKEATKQSVTPFFDLNKISGEEEELQGKFEAARVEESKRSNQRVIGDEQQNDKKLSICRNVRNGTNRAEKRKISWQDQVALRV